MFAAFYTKLYEVLNLFLYYVFCDFFLTISFFIRIIVIKDLFT